jgi:DNA methylase
MTDLVRLEQAERMLSEIATAEQARDLMAEAAALRAAARQKDLGLSAVNHATAIMIRAELRLGRAITEARESGALRPRGRPANSAESAELTVPLGMTSVRATEAERLARVHDDAAVMTAAAEATAAGRQMSRDRLLRKAGKWPTAKPKSVAGPELGVRAGDFAVVLADIPDGTVDLILTDPPYAVAHTELWSRLGEFAARVLRPGGSLVAYSGQSTLPEALDGLRPHLRYWWTFALWQRFGHQPLLGKSVYCGWKPLVWCVKDHRGTQEMINDVVEGSRPRKSEHEWAQGVAEAARLIGDLTEPGGLVVDPMAGSGTVAIACQHTGRPFIGAEIRG